MIQKTTSRDTIVDAIHRTRRRVAEKFGGDISAILEDARERQEASGRAIWQAPSSDKALNPTGDSRRIESEAVPGSGRRLPLVVPNQ